MNKTGLFMVFAFFISGLVIATVNPVSAELVEDSWNTKTSMNHVRAAFGVAAVDGKIYAIGGYTDYDTFLNVNERYDPKTDKWTILAAMPTPRQGFNIIACNDKIYCMGGTIYENGQWFSCKANEVYDPVTNSWSAMASTPFEGAAMMVQTVNGKIFVIVGGVGLAGELYQYDPVTDLWTQKDKPPRVDFTSSAVVNDKIIVYCNLYYWMSPFEAITRMYDVETDTWSVMKTQPFVSTLIQDSYRYPPVYTLASSGATTGLFAPQRIYSFFEGKTFVHDPISDTWSTAKDTPATIADNTAVVVVNTAVAVVDDVFYVIGSNFTEQYVPIGYSTTPLSSEPTPLPSEPSTSESTSFRALLTQLVVIATVLAVGVAMALFLYLRGRKRNKGNVEYE